MSKTFTIGNDPETECYGLYDENGVLIRGWQSGDDISRVLKDILSNFGVGVRYKEITVDGDIPDSI